jgi:hypothetical protein
MEPLGENELKQALREWEAPDAPPDLERRIFSRVPGAPGWRWLLSGSIRVPVPAGILVLVLLAFIAYSSYLSRKAVTLSDFQPVKQLQPRIIRSAYEAH